MIKICEAHLLNKLKSDVPTKSMWIIWRIFQQIWTKHAVNMKNEEILGIMSWMNHQIAVTPVSPVSVQSTLTPGKRPIFGFSFRKLIFLPSKLFQERGGEFHSITKKYNFQEEGVVFLQTGQCHIIFGESLVERQLKVDALWDIKIWFWKWIVEISKTVSLHEKEIMISAVIVRNPFAAITTTTREGMSPTWKRIIALVILSIQQSKAKQSIKKLTRYSSWWQMLPRPIPGFLGR